MWQEARRQEKLIRNTMADSVKRHERRRTFYESIRKDPAEFMQLHGRQMPIRVEPSTFKSSSLRKWQGDPSILIDRFDARAHLEQVPLCATTNIDKRRLKDDVEELQCNFERYRVLALNDFKKISEERHLQVIGANEFWPTSAVVKSNRKAEQEQKRAPTQAKGAVIGFDYGKVPGTNNNSTSTKVKEDANNHDSSSDDSLDDDTTLNDHNDGVDVEKLSAEGAFQLNKCGADYDIGRGAFVKMLSLDKKEQDDRAELREIDRATITTSGREAKAERATLKRRRALIIGRGLNNDEATTTLLSFLAGARKRIDANESSSSADSGDDRATNIEFITSFGTNQHRSSRRGEDSEDEGACRGSQDFAQGPQLPPVEYRRLLELRRNRSPNPEDRLNEGLLESRRRKREDSGSVSPLRYNRRSPARSSRHHRRRSSRKRTRSRDRSNRRHRSHRDRSSSATRRHRKAEHKSSRSSNSTKDEAAGSKHGNELPEHREKPEACPSASRPLSSGSEDSSGSERSLRSSMSDSEKERVERKNRRIRMHRVKRKLRGDPGAVPTEMHTTVQNAQTKVGGVSEEARKLRDQMHKTLERTVTQLRTEEKQRLREQSRKREDDLLEESRMLHKRERERRRTENRAMPSVDHERSRRNRRRRHASSSSRD